MLERIDSLTVYAGNSIKATLLSISHDSLVTEYIEDITMEAKSTMSDVTLYYDSLMWLQEFPLAGDFAFRVSIA